MQFSQDSVRMTWRGQQCISKCYSKHWMTLNENRPITWKWNFLLFLVRSNCHAISENLVLLPTFIEKMNVNIAFHGFEKAWPGLNFIDVLRTAFTLVAPKSVRIQSSCQYLFTLLGATIVKAVRRTLMKLSPGANPVKLFFLRCLFSSVLS